VSGLLYYIPGQTRAIKLEQLPELGLAHAFEGRLTPREVSRGPDGDRGVVIADPDRLSEHLLGYWPERQTWHKIPGAADKPVWLGSPHGERVEPRDLIRETPLAGHWVHLADGQDWLVPVARGLADDEDSLTWYSALPAAVTLDDAGNWTRGGVVAKYQQLWQIACDWWDAVQAAPVEEVEDGDQGTARVRVRFSFENVCDAALVALATNYRLNKAEVAFLGLFDDACAREVLMALVDWPVAREFLKKKLAAAHAGSSTAAGPPAGTAATGPASPTSPP